MTAAVGLVGAVLLARAGGLGLAVLVVWVALAWKPVVDRPRLCRWGSLAGLIVCVPLALLLVQLAVSISHNTCDGSAMLCFGGSRDAWSMAYPVSVLAVLAVLQVIGLTSRPDRLLGRVCATVALTAITSVVPIVIAYSVIDWR